MTKKDYKLIAKVINEQRRSFHGLGIADNITERVLDDLVDALIPELTANNPRFNKNTFLRDCGCPT